LVKGVDSWAPRKIRLRTPPVLLGLNKQDLVNPAEQKELFNSYQDALLDKPEKKFPIR
jgi:hypothetical protein